MSEQTDIFTALDAKHEAMERVEEHADDEWKDAAYKAVLLAANVYENFTSDDVMELIPPEVETHEHRALGPVMLRAAKAGLIVKTGMVRNSDRRSRHAAPLTIWRKA